MYISLCGSGIDIVFDSVFKAFVAELRFLFPIIDLEAKFWANSSFSLFDWLRLIQIISPYV